MWKYDLEIPNGVRFDREWYLNNNPDVKAHWYYWCRPYKHYVKYGEAEGRKPYQDHPVGGTPGWPHDYTVPDGVKFCHDYYLNKYIDVKNNWYFWCRPYKHYVLHGKAEGRKPCPDKPPAPSPAPTPQTKYPPLGAGDPYCPFVPERRMRDTIVRTLRENNLNATIMRLICFHSDGYLRHARSFNPYNQWDDARSGFNQAWWDELRRFVKHLNDNGIKPIIDIFDFWATHVLETGREEWMRKGIDPFNRAHTGAYKGTITTHQKRFISKAVNTLQGLKILAWSEGNEGQNVDIGSGHIPSSAWRKSFIEYIRPRIGSVPLACYHHKGIRQSGFDLVEMHKDPLSMTVHDKCLVTETGAPLGQWCKAKVWHDCWGGGAETAYYKEVAKKCIRKNAAYVDSFWGWWHWGGDGNTFAQRQIAGIKQARNELK